MIEIEKERIGDETAVDVFFPFRVDGFQFLTAVMSVGDALAPRILVPLKTELVEDRVRVSFVYDDKLRLQIYVVGAYEGCKTLGRTVISHRQTLHQDAGNAAD